MKPILLERGGGEEKDKFRRKSFLKRGRGSRKVILLGRGEVEREENLAGWGGMAERNIEKPILLERGGGEKDEFRRKSFLKGGGGLSKAILLGRGGG